MTTNNNISNLLYEGNSKMDKRNRITHTKYEVNKEERLDILTNSNEIALLLYQFYLRMAAIPDAFMEDKDAAAYFQWSVRKVATARKALEKLGYFKRITYSSSTGKKSVTYYLTKERVAKA